MQGFTKTEAQGMLDRKKIQNGLLHGSKAEIARRAGVKMPVVSNWFADKFNSERIANAAVEVYAEDVAKKNALEAKFKEAEKGKTV